MLGASREAQWCCKIVRPLATQLWAWSPVVDFANWVQKNQMVKASVDAKNELGLTEIHEIHDAFYKYFIQTYLGGLDPRFTTAVNPTNHLTDQLGPTLLFNSADELMLPSALHFVQQAAIVWSDISIHVVPALAMHGIIPVLPSPETKRFFDHHLVSFEDKALNKATD